MSARDAWQQAIIPARNRNYTTQTQTGNRDYREGSPVREVHPLLLQSRSKQITRAEVRQARIRSEMKSGWPSCRQNGHDPDVGGVGRVPAAGLLLPRGVRPPLVERPRLPLQEEKAERRVLARHRPRVCGGGGGEDEGDRAWNHAFRIARRSSAPESDPVTVRRA